MDKDEAKTCAKAIYLQTAALAGFQVSPFSPERLATIVENGFNLGVPLSRRPEAVANLLRLIAETFEIAQMNGDTELKETTVDAAQQKVCPVYPF